MGRPKSFNRAETLDRATQLFWKKGFADTSLQDLESKTGVNKSGLYAEFKGKDDLFTECVKRFSQISEGVAILSTQPLGRRNIERLLLAGQTCKGQKGCFLANSVREFAILPGRARQEIREHMARVHEAVLMNVKACPDVESPEDVAQIILTFNAGLALSSNLGEVANPERRVSELLDRVLGKELS